METWKRANSLEIELGYTGISLFSESEIADGQVGYSVGENGENLCGTARGDWKKEWTVIGYEIDNCDPVFVDTSVSECPVFTTSHGKGNWKPILISKSYSAFTRILGELAKVAEGRADPVALELKPMTTKEYNSFVDFARSVGEVDDSTFWEWLVADEDAGIGPESSVLSTSLRLALVTLGLMVIAIAFLNLLGFV